MDQKKAPFASLFPRPYSEKYPELAAFVQSLPKTDNHVHAEGALSTFFLQNHTEEMFAGFYGSASPFVKPGSGYSKFQEFDKFSDDFLNTARSVLSSPKAYAEAAGLFLADCRRQNIHYVELSIDLRTASWEGMEGGMPAVLQAIRKEAEVMAPDIELKLFATMRRKEYHRHAEEMEAMLNCPDLDGFDISGSERGPIQEWTADFYKRAQAAGKLTKAHAGEFEEGEKVLQAVEDLHLRRVQHGGKIADSPELIEKFRHMNVGFDMCPISNDSLGAQDLRQTPILKMLRAGLRVTVADDDPQYFGTTNDQYVALAALAGATRKELVQLARNGFLNAEMSPEAKAPFLKQLAEIERSLETPAEKVQRHQRHHLLRTTPFPPRQKMAEMPPPVSVISEVAFMR